MLMTLGDLEGQFSQWRNFGLKSGGDQARGAEGAEDRDA